MKRKAKIFRFYALFLTCCLTAFAVSALCGCSPKTGGIIRYDLPDRPETLDPQFALSDSACLIIANSFEGLTSFTPDGRVIPACAERWDISSDHLTYTFFLREGLCWSDGSKLSSDDFVFSLQRLFDSSVTSPSAADYLNIKNASSVLSGASPVSSLGVVAPNDRTLSISLEQPDPALPMLLSRPAAMPCQKEFFTLQKGKYGVGAANLLCNGPFFISNWEERSLSLLTNEYYRDKPSIDGVSLYIDRGDPVSLFLSGDSDVCVVPFHRLNDVKELDGQRFHDESWVLLLNPEAQIASHADFRAALIGALDIAEFNSLLPPYISQPTGAIPQEATLLGFNYRELAGPFSPPPPVSNPRQLLLDALERLRLEKLPAATLLVSDFSPGPDLGGIAQKNWQSTLSAFVNLEQLSYQELITRVSLGSFDMAIVPLTAQRSNAVDYLARFERTALSPSAGENEQHSESAPGSSLSVSELIARARQQADPITAAADLFEAEQTLIDSYVLLPLFDAPALFVHQQGATGAVCAAASQTVWFANAKIIR